jgi:glycosyltransferase involved in cell wall biosynthesis
VLALQLWWKSRRYDAVLTTGNATSLWYGLLCRLTFRPQQQVIAQLYLDERHGLARLLHDPLMRFVLRGAAGVIVTSRGEIPLVEERFGVPLERQRFVAFHTNVIEPCDLGRGDGYGIAVGRNYRDYETLVRAVQDLDVPITVVCGSDQLTQVELPRNMTVYREIPWDRYTGLLRGADFAIVPLSTRDVPAGQVAVLEAMAYGRPVITSVNIGTVDYVHDEQDGLLYEMGDATQLREQIRRLATDPELRDRLGVAAYERVTQEFSWERHVDAKIEAIRELAGLRPAA